MKFSEFNEDAVTDREHRRQALEAYNELIDIIDKKGMSVFRTFANGLYADNTALNHSHGLNIAIIHDESGNKVAGASPHTQTMAFFLNTKKDIISQLKNHRQRTSFIHEFQHFIDYNRAAKLRSTADLDDAEYYNDPSETNAFYQQMIHDWEMLWDRLSNAARKNLLRSHWGSFDEWHKYLLKNIAEKDFAKNLNNKNQKKLKRRLYQYWSSTLKDIENEL